MLFITNGIYFLIAIKLSVPLNECMPKLLNKPPKTQNVLLRLPSDLAKKLKKEAKDKGFRSFNQFAIDAFERLIKSAESK